MSVIRGDWIPATQGQAIRGDDIEKAEENMIAVRVKKELVDEAGLDRTITRLSHEILERNRGTQNLAIVGIRTRGAVLAERIHKKIQEITGVDIPMGILDITLYRDDFRRALTQPQVRSTEIRFDIADINLILVDDVLYTGRTVRAALDALIDFGRPKRIQLAVLVDRGHRELPIKADFVGKNVPTSIGEEIRVRLKEVDDLDAVLLIEAPSEPEE
jgi:pyrimidine operon attenuation protein/uracil phosphoribosyltransferase